MFLLVATWRRVGTPDQITRNALNALHLRAGRQLELIRIINNINIINIINIIRIIEDEDFNCLNTGDETGEQNERFL